VRTKSTESKARAPSILDPDAEKAAGITVEELAAFYVLDSIKQFGPQKFKWLHQQSVRWVEAVVDPAKLGMSGKRGEAFRQQLSGIPEDKRVECRQRAIRQINTAAQHGSVIITYDSPFYPRNVYESNNPIAVLYVRGARDVLKAERVVACVGSRNIRPPYSPPGEWERGEAMARVRQANQPRSSGS
jgi:predicted Rossmann fold nucleotide-binding protein DprA/Smf involved in DNA uptake